MLELASVRAGYGRIDVLHGVNLTLNAGEVYALLGPNGAGKSTTLAVASGQIVPSSGSLMLCGRDVTGVTADALARAGVCLIPEGRGIFPNLTVTENLRMATFTGTHFNEVQERVFSQFPRLQERRKQTAGTLSGGEQQMLAMGRALATDPAVLLIDELSMGLAPLIVAELYDHVRRIARLWTFDRDRRTIRARNPRRGRFGGHHAAWSYRRDRYTDPNRRRPHECVPRRHASLTGT